MKQLGVAFDEVADPARSSRYESAKVLKYSPAGKVPILIDGDVTVWESLAIMEYVGDALGAPVWPQDRKARAMARSVAAEMHSGFSALRAACPMNLGKKYATRDRGRGCCARRGALQRNRAAGAGELRGKRVISVRRGFRRPTPCSRRS